MLVGCPLRLSGASQQSLEVDGLPLLHSSAAMLLSVAGCARDTPFRHDGLKLLGMLISLNCMGAGQVARRGQKVDLSDETRSPLTGRSCSQSTNFSATMDVVFQHSVLYVPNPDDEG